MPQENPSGSRSADEDRDVEQALYDERLGRVIGAVQRRFEEGGRTGITAFDRAWLLLRRDRPLTPPALCQRTRMLVSHFLDVLEPALDA